MNNEEPTQKLSYSTNDLTNITTSDVKFTLDLNDPSKGQNGDVNTPSNGVALENGDHGKRIADINKNGGVLATYELSDSKNNAVPIGNNHINANMGEGKKMFIGGRK